MHNAAPCPPFLTAEVFSWWARRCPVLVESPRAWPAPLPILQLLATLSPSRGEGHGVRGTRPRSHDARAPPPSSLPPEQALDVGKLQFDVGRAAVIALPGVGD